MAADHSLLSSGAASLNSAIKDRTLRRSNRPFIGPLKSIVVQPFQDVGPPVEHPAAVLDELRTGALVAILGESSGRGVEIFGYVGGASPAPGVGRT
jgi:hypothetical protein